jgi:8-oxo-dGTP pyrophosphatase MutT (NUDIX family)
MRWKKLSEKFVYENPWMKVREDQVIRPDGKKGIYGVIITDPSVFIVPETKGRKIILVKQFRYPTQKYSWEIPAGKMDKGEVDPKKTALRELLEETGFKANAVEKIGEFDSLNGLVDETGIIYAARELEETDMNEQEEEGIEEVKEFSINEIKEMMKSGEINDCQTIASIFIYLNSAPHNQ